ncbi:MAG: steroid C27-monooxygenase, partial [Actinobacteria bacterium]|nr:steroid C27-monooxygenase [Actinomycetota bacterium]
MTSTTDLLPEGFDDFTDPWLLEKGIPHEAFRRARQTSPMHWVEQKPGAADGMSHVAGHGYWAATRHEDVAAISKNSKDWSTEENGSIIRFSEGMTREQVELQRVILLNQDPPHHTQHRSIVSRGFTPRSINELEQLMTQRAHDIVAAAVQEGSGNFVEQVAAELPLQAIADLIGVPQEDRHKLFHWSNQMLASDDPDVQGDPEVAAAEILAYSMAMAA